MVTISCREIKFEDITVTSHPNIPRNPIIERTEKAQQSIGKITHRIFLKITPRVTIRKMNIPIPKILISFLINVIMSSVIIDAPPRKSSASCL
jgi:hypothetical protein